MIMKIYLLKKLHFRNQTSVSKKKKLKGKYLVISKANKGTTTVMQNIDGYIEEAARRH